MTDMQEQQQHKSVGIMQKRSRNKQRKTHHCGQSGIGIDNDIIPSIIEEDMMCFFVYDNTV
jgi:hypothetical protein